MVTFSVMFNLLVFSSIAIVLLKYIFKDNKVILQLDTRFLLICMLVIMCRMLVPVESPLTNNIAISKVYPEVYKVLKEPLIAGSRLEINIIGVLEFIWFAGAVVRLIQIFCSYVRISRVIRSCVEIKNPSMIEIMEKVNQKYRHPVKFRLVHLEDGSTPCVFGVWNPCIVITDIEVTEKELEFIFSHEMKHYYRGDLLIIILREVFNAIYWWNPLAYKLNDLIAQTQEINVDFSVMRKLGNKGTLDYTACLLKVTREREKYDTEERWLMSFQKESTMLLTKRINLMMQNLEISKRKTIASVLISVVMVGLIAICPNVIIFEPYGIAEEDANGSVGLKDEGNYYILNKNGTYRLYIDGKYFMTSEEILVEDIPIYLDSAEEK